MKTSLLGISVAVLIAGFLCAPSGMASQKWTNADLIQKIAIIGDKDNREYLEDYAAANNMSRAAAYKEFSGSTRLICDGENGNANVILQGDTLVTAGHMFYNIDDDGTCHGKKKFKECFIETIKVGGGAGKHYTVDPASIVTGTGDNCPRPADAGRDWAVFRLKCLPGFRCRVPGAMPYATNCDSNRQWSPQSLVDRKILTFTGVTDNFGGITPIARRVALVCANGHIRDADTLTGADRITYDCSAGFGGSGGGVFTEEEEQIDTGQRKTILVLIGVMTVTSKYDHDHESFTRNGLHGNFTDAAFLSGAFCDAVQQENDSFVQALTEFNLKDGVDIDGTTESKIDSVYLPKCESACSEDSQCQAFSYDKWNRVCFLKSRADNLEIHAGFESGVRKSVAMPAMSASPIKMVRYPRAAFPGPGYRTLSTGNADDCEAACKKEQACTAFTFEAPEPAVEQTAEGTNDRGSTCHLYSEAGGRTDNSFAESGVKAQTP